MDEVLTDYLLQTLPEEDSRIKELERTAHQDGIPIMDAVSIQFVMQLIRLTKPKTILEIGSAVGYSALRMLEAGPKAHIVTIEKDEQRYEQAVRNINERRKQDHIRIIHGDAIDELKGMPIESFDLVLIDAAKSQYRRFFELSAPLLTNDGFILTDNVLFKGYVADEEKQHSRYQKIARKIRQYNDWLINHPDFTTTIVPVGDGIAISKNSEGKELLSTHA
ncbi:O-methyltransferase [Lentibacillus kapialis]|uniref:tRNA 5-hydroxyuridine methyltransferase n=1 Tax=Lentibacillus kapialis TaxID=340214 RepID=A0A917PLY3_9BACI|nr:O-methyltransferase [Lentibacillus kapialis]GGJ83802.1 O-methyltransferase [Lentibacillus kapialis]